MMNRTAGDPGCFLLTGEFSCFYERKKVYYSISILEKVMEQTIMTHGHFQSSNVIILDEEFSGIDEPLEIIIKPIEQKKSAKRKLGALKGMIHIHENFDEPLDDFKEYMVSDLDGGGVTEFLKN